MSAADKARKDTVGIGLDWEVFAHEGEAAVGAVRHVANDHLTVYIEGGGDIKIKAAHIQSIHDEKVVLDMEKLPEDIQRMIRLAHSDEVDVAKGET